MTTLDSHKTEQKTLDLSIVLVNWNTWDYLQKAIRTIQETVHMHSYEIIVVDNGSNAKDGIKKLPEIFPGVQLILNGKNLGFSKANNRGLEKVKGSYILLLNADTFQVENAIDQAVLHMKDNPRIGVLGIRHVNAEGSPQASWHFFPSFWADLRGLVGFPSKTPSYANEKEEFDVDWVCGSFFMMSLECLKKVGKLDERYFIYDEDIDYCQRVKKAGFKVRYWGGKHFIHVGSGSGPRIRDKVYSNIRSRLTYYTEHASCFHGLFFYMVVALKWGIGILRGIIRGERKDEVEKRWRRWGSWIWLQSSEEGIGSGILSNEQSG
jgi:GT2 family glycosyltransferase